MAKKKQEEIPRSFYYDGRKKKWNKENFTHPDRPTPNMVEWWLQEWNNTEGYPEQENALDKLFVNLCPNNTDLNDVLIKVCTLNDFYSTNIYGVTKVAKKIKELSIDSRLNSSVRDTAIVQDLDEAVKKETGKSIYSFATKYCSHHKPNIYPIYDSYVDLLLRYYRDNEGLLSAIRFDDNDLSNYDTFCKVIDAFRQFYGLQQYSVKEIDKYLWQVGKKCFPKWKNSENNDDVVE